MIYKMLLHCKSICSTHNPTCSVGKVGVILDHLMDEQTGGSERFQELPQVTCQARPQPLVICFFLIHTVSLTLAEKLYKQENITKRRWYKYQS